jgi:hypothetical protein
MQNTNKLIFKNEPQYLLPVFLVISLNFYQYFATDNYIKYLFTDDLWVLIGSNYGSLYEKFFCCSTTSPFASLSFQGLYSIIGSDPAFINTLFVIGQFIPFSILFLKDIPLTKIEKSFTIIFLLSSPMYLNYSVRPKPYIYEVIIIFVIANLYFKIKNKKTITIYDFLLLSILTAFSFVALIGAASCFLLLLKEFINKKEKMHFSKFGFMTFSSISTGLFLLANILKDDTLNTFWSSYFMPLEGGLPLKIRWLYYSFIRLLSESDATNLGFSNFSTTLAILIFFVSILLLIRNEKGLLFFVFTLFTVSLVLAILQIYPFGGSRTNIYLYSALAISFGYGVSYLFKFKIKYKSSLMFLIVFLILLSNFYNNTISYKNTTNTLNQDTVELIIDDIINEDTEVIVHHGSHWFVGLYLPVEIQMESIQLFPKTDRVLGSGSLGLPAPNILDDKFIQLCFDFPKTRGENCSVVIEDYLESSGTNSFKFVGFYTEEKDFSSYLEIFNKYNFSVENLLVEKDIFYYLISK